MDTRSKPTSTSPTIRTISITTNITTNANISIAANNITDGGSDMSAVLKLAEVLPQSKLEALKCAAPQLHTTVHHVTAP